MTKQSMLIVCLVSIIFAASLESEGYRDRGSWKKTLHEKSAYFEENTKERHNIEGTYPSSVRLIPPKHYAGSQQGAWKHIIETGKLPPGWIFDHGTTGLSNVAHTSSWTGCYLTAEAFRVAFLRKEFGEDSAEFREAYERANEVISGIRKLTLVSGQPGYLARGIVYGHGVTYGEREYPWGESGTRDLWHQGVGELSHFRYRGGPSHHNYDHVFRGLGIYYFIAADDKQKEAIREIVADMSQWAHLKNDMTVMHTDGKRVSTVLIGGWRGRGGSDRPSGGSLMATTGLKIAALITGNEETANLYDKWVKQLRYREFKDSETSIMGRERGNWDDTDHLLGDLYLLNLIEEDEELLTFYRKCVRGSWKSHKDEKQAWFNFVYQAVLGDEYGDPEGSIWNLQTHPTCRIFQPQMNSIRSDIESYTEDGRMESRYPLPVYERRSDNEYEWKGSPYGLDGWYSRIVNIVEISPHDPYVQLAIDGGGMAYWSNTKGEIWHGVDDLSGVQDIILSPDYPWLAIAATDKGVYRASDGGETWHGVSEIRVNHLCFDPENTHVLYAIGADGIYKSDDFGERAIGTHWRLISGAAPSGSEKTFAVDPRGERARLYMFTDQGIYIRMEGDLDWMPPPRLVRERGFGDISPIRGRPLWIRVDMTTPGRLSRAVHTSGRQYSGVYISVSEDDGKTWSPIIGDRDLRRRFAIQDLRVDHTDPNTWYGRLDNGVAITHDAGETWTLSNKGLDIPRVSAIWVPRHSTDIYAGTPAGAYVSYDRGDTWHSTSLILQEGGAIRSEIGGIGYLTAYWMGRYHGFISKEEAERIWWDE